MLHSTSFVAHLPAGNSLWGIATQELLPTGTGGRVGEGTGGGVGEGMGDLVSSVVVVVVDDDVVVTTVAAVVVVLEVVVDASTGL